MNHKNIQKDNEVLNTLEIISFYLPLILNASMMTLSTPFINFGIGRSINFREALAAFSTSFAIMLVINSLTLSSRKVFTTHIKDRLSFNKILKFNLVIALFCTVFCLLLGLTSFGTYFFGNILKVPENIIPYSKSYMFFISPMPILNVLRIAFQSLITIYRKTILRLFATIIRLAIVIVMVLIFTISLPNYPVQSAALALVLAAIIETIFLYLISLKYKNVPESKYIKNYYFRLTNIYLFKFSFPFFVTSVIRALIFSVINFFIGYTPDPVSGLAGFGIVRSIILFTAIPLTSLPTLVVLLANSEQSFKKIKIFTLNLTIISTALVLFLSISPVKHHLFATFFNLSGNIYQITQGSFIYIFILPLLTTIRSFFEGVLLIMKRPGPAGWASIIRILSLFFLAPIIMYLFPKTNGVLLGILLMTFSGIIESIYITGNYFYYKSKKIKLYFI